jgi:hypothetical protein
VAGQILFEEDTALSRILHDETAFMVQKRLQRRGIPMIVVPVRLDLREQRAIRAPQPLALVRRDEAHPVAVASSSGRFFVSRTKCRTKKNETAANDA